jgi:tyrosyl-tRNA synthetase
VREHEKDPPKRVAQHRLAREFVELIHGPLEAKNAEEQHRLLFSNRSKPISLGSAGAAAGDQGPSLVTSHINQTNSPSANIFLPESCVINQPMARVLYSAGLVVSRSEGNRLAASQGAYIGSRSDGKGNMSDDLTFSPVKLWKPEDTQKYIIDGDLLVLRAGKWKVRIVRILSDEEFEKRGLDAPGWKEEEKAAKRKAELEEAVRIRDAERAKAEQS